LRKEIQKDQSYLFEWSFFDKNIQEVPASGTISVYNNSGTALVSAAAVSIETDGVIKYLLDATYTTTLDYNYKIELTYRVGDITHRPFYLFDVVNTPLQNTVRDEDLFQFAPDLRDKVQTNMVETTSTGTTTTFISTELRALNLDFKGGNCEILITDTTKHYAEITGWESDANRATFQPAYTSAVASGLKVRIRASFQRFIDDAWERFVKRDIRNKVGIVAGYIDTTVADNLVIFKALELICFGKMEEEGDKWSLRATKFDDKYKDEMTKLSAPYDRDEDGNIDDGENKDRPHYKSAGIVI